MQDTQQAIFCIGEEDFGFNIMDVNTIEKFITVTPVANSPKNIKGIIELRGSVIPVYSLRGKFGLEDKEPDDDTRFIITTSNGILIAYEVDKMKEIARLNPNEINEVPAIVKNKDTSYTKAVTYINVKLVLLLNNDGILNEDEQKSIKTIISKKLGK